MAFTSSYTDRLIQQSEYYYGTPEMTPGLSGSFSGSFQGDGSGLTGVTATTPTLQEVTDQGATTTNDIQITGSLSVSGSGISFIASGGTVFSIAETGSFTLGEGATNSSDTNVTIGRSAISNGAFNIAIGKDADNDGQSYNIAIGSGANTTNTSYGIAIGGSTYAKESTIAIGHSSTGGTGTVAIGYDAGSDAGDYNVLLGYAAGKSTTGDNNIIIGSGSLGAASMANQLRIGHSDVIAISGSLTTGDVIFYNTASAPNFSGSFQGDGSQLTGISSDPFPFTGTAGITGSISITGSAQEIVFAGATSTNYPKIDFPNSINIGNGTTMHTSSLGDVVIGQNASTEYGSTYLNTQRRVAIGLNADVNGAGSVAIGHGATVGSTEGVAIGYGSETTAYRATAVGYNASAASAGVAIGRSATTTGPNSIAIGGTQTGTTGYSVAIGGTASTTGVSVGVSSSAGTNAVGIGQDADATGTGAIALGTKALASGQYSIALVGRQYGGGQIENSSGSSFAIYHNDSTPSFFLHQNNKSFYNSTGNFGFNTMDPTATLTVSGSTDITGSFKVTGSADFSDATVTGITATAGSTSGRVVFTTTNGELTTESGFDYNSTTNQLTVESLNVTHLTSSFITSSRIHTSGSNIFGDDTTDTQTLIGTTKMTGSAEVDGNTQITGSLTISGSVASGSVIYGPTNDYAIGLGNDIFVGGAGDIASKIQFKFPGTTGGTGYIGMGSDYNNTKLSIRKGNGNILSLSAGSTNAGIGWSGGTMSFGQSHLYLIDSTYRATLKFGNRYGQPADTDGTGVIQMLRSGAPTTDITDCMIIYAGDSDGAGTVSPHFRTEDGRIISLGKKSVITGSLIVSSSVVDFTGATAISGSTFSGSFVGDGSGLTNLPSSDPFPFSGDAEITGSLIVSGSFNAFDRRDNTVTIGKGASDNNYQFGVAIGNSAEVTNNYAIAIGDGADSAAYSTTIGRASSTGQRSLTINTYGQNPATNTETRAFHWYTSNNTTPDLKFYYNNDSWWNSTGNFGFGHTSPLATVHISSSTSSSLIVEGSGSTLFEVIGSEGTLFSIDDDLDGVIFTANDRSGLPVLEASASGEVYIGKSPQSLYTTAVISSTTAATTQSIYGLSTSSYGGAFFDYTVQSGSNARAGSIMSVWNGSNISFTETTTTDIGDTTDFNIIVHISQSQAQIASHATRAGYNIKTIIRSI